MSAPQALPPAETLGPRVVLLWGAAACLAAVALRAQALWQPALLLDDFQIVAQSWTREDARANLWVPANEHSMPPGRVTTWLLIRAAGRQGLLPLAGTLQGVLALVAAMLLVYLLVRRELGQALPALVAMTLFGVNTHYRDAVIWYSASFGLLGLVSCLLGLLAAQRWRQAGRTRSLALAAFWCGLAPAWFASGVLAGPLCTLYLLGPGPVPPRPRGRGGRLLLALVPCAGTAASLAVTFPHNGERILNLPRVEVEKKAWETLDPLTGLTYALRAAVDDLVPGALGVTELTTPRPLVWVLLAVLAGAAAWWWRRSPRRDLLLLGLGFVFGSYLLIYTGRAYFAYEEMHHWGRYHLYAHLGLVLYLCGGRPLRPRVAPYALGFILLVALAQVSRSGPHDFPGADRQAGDWRRIEAVDARCRECRVDAATAREALADRAFEVNGCFGSQVNGRVLRSWDFLHGSPDPRPVSVEEARRLLMPALDP